MDVKYFVRTIKTREYDYSQIDCTELVDKNPDYIQSFIDQLRIISDYDAVLLEDDLILCDDFDNEIKKAIEKYPNKIINFFEDYGKFYPTHEKSHFAWNQCTFYPKGLAGKIADKMQEIKNAIPVRYRQYDNLEWNAMHRLKLTHISYRPCLVQHIGGNSSLIQNGGIRATLYFKNYLDKLNIKYEDAPRYEKELEELLMEDIKQ